MNPIFSLKNFRSFGEEGADFELAPITVLTGCNSAGKSSLAKALLLLSKNAKGDGMWDNYDIEKRNLPAIDLKASSFDLKLGGYNKIVNSLNKDGDVEFNYSIWSSYLNEEVICRRIFQIKKGVLNDGKLKQFVIEKQDGTIVLRGFPKSDIYTEYISLEEHFENILTNYEKFLLAYGYGYFFLLKQKLDGLEKDSGEAYRKVLEKIEEGERALNQFGMTIEEAVNYDKDAIMHWHTVNQREIKKTKVDFWGEELTNDDIEEMRQQMYYTNVINECVSPWFISRLTTIDSSTNKISRVYNVEDKDKLSVVLCGIVNGCSDFKYHSGGFVNKWLNTFGIGDSIEIEGTDEGLGVRVFLVNNENRRLLADEGCGLTQVVSLLLQISILIEHKGGAGIWFNDEEDLQYEKTVVCIEEPEVHLHPKYQSLLAEMFVEAYQKYNIHFIIETHSEYMIRKLQVIVADVNNALTANDISLNYVEKGEDGLSTNRKIGVMENGRLTDAFGEGFFDEAGGLSRELLRLSL